MNGPVSATGRFRKTRTALVQREHGQSE